MNLLAITGAKTRPLLRPPAAWPIVGSQSQHCEHANFDWSASKRLSATVATVHNAYVGGERRAATELAAGVGPLGDRSL